MTDTAHEHIIPLWTYLKIGLTLFALTIITVWVAQYNLGEINLVVAMAIAATKGTLVAMYFMHLKYTNRLYAMVFIGALLMLSIFIVFTMFDTMTRDDIYSIKAHPIVKDAAIYRHDSAVSTTDTSAIVDSSKLDTGH